MPNVRANIKPNTDKALTPLAYSIRTITLTNHHGKTADIQNIITDFTITESLYTSALIFRANVKDVVNFIEEYEIIGQERINVRLGRQDFNSLDPVEVNLDFIVSEYPTFGRGGQQNTQVFTITAISPHAFISKLKSISRGITGVVSDEIRKILHLDLCVDKMSPFDKSSGRFQGVIPISHPLDAAHWLLRHAFDTSGKPMFLHETLRDGMRLDSLSKLISDKTNSVYRTFYDHPVFNSLPSSERDYKQRQERIYDITSEFKLSKILLMTSGGAFASKTTLVDIGTKSIETKIYDYAKEFNPKNSLEGYSTLSDKFIVKLENPNMTKKLNECSSGFQRNVPVNALAYHSNVPNYHGLTSSIIAKLGAEIENFDTFVHDLTVAGDFNLSAGKKIRLRIPKPIDFSALDRNTITGPTDDIYDRLISGNYIITGVIHSFSTEYYCKIRIKKDSISFNLNHK